MAQGFASARQGPVNAVFGLDQVATYPEIANASASTVFPVVPGVYHFEVIALWLSTNTTSKAYSSTLTPTDGATLARMFWVQEYRSSTASTNSGTSVFDSTSTTTGTTVTLDSGTTASVNTFRRLIDGDVVVSVGGTLTFTLTTGNAALTLGGISNARLLRVG